ncbi:MAG: hypothetical protein AMXMBFR82_48010 [Candidatus Hydrogenedentota bacterium]
MIPAGYMYKRVSLPNGLTCANVRDICSVSSCISENFCDYITHWKHNGFWFFNQPSIMETIAKTESTPLDGLTLCFYRIYPMQWVEDEKTWRAFGPDPAFETDVVEPMHSKRLGFDVVTYSTQTAPECSPLSCNYLADRIAVNAHCLFDSFDTAKSALESGAFDNSEPGPFRILEVHTIQHA